MKSLVLRTTISIIFIGLFVLLVRDDFPRILHELKTIDRSLLLTAILIFLTTILILSVRLRLMFSVEDIPLKLSDAVNLTFIGYFFNNFLPTAVGGDLVKAMCAARVTGQAMTSATSVLMDRVFGLFTFILIPSVSLLFFLRTIENPAVPVIVYSFLGVSIFCFFIIFHRGLAARFRFIEDLLRPLKLDRIARTFYENLHNFKRHRGIIAKAIALSIVGQSISILALYLFAFAMDARAPVIYFFLMVPIVHLLSMVPSLNGLGVREWAYITFLTPYIGREYAGAVGIIWFGLLLLLSTIGGMIYLFRHDYHVRFSFKKGEVIAQ